jgi:hypothetical protein
VIPDLASLARADFRRTRRISTVFDFIVEERESLKSILTG